MLALPTARSALPAHSPPQLAPHCVNSALAVITVLLAPHHGLILIAAEATTALTALVLQLPAPFKCLHLVDGVLCKSKALLFSRIQPAASINAFGT